MDLYKPQNKLICSLMSAKTTRIKQSFAISYCFKDIQMCWVKICTTVVEDHLHKASDFVVSWIIISDRFQ